MKLLLATLLVAMLLVVKTEVGVAQNGIRVVPPTNQTVAFGSDENITYECSVSDNRPALWQFRDILLEPGSTIVELLHGIGVFITDGATPSETKITVTRKAKEQFLSEDIKIECLAFDFPFHLVVGDSVYIRTFFPPDIPRNFDLNPFPGNFSLILTWNQPYNTIVDAGDPVVTTYAVTASSPSSNFTVITNKTYYIFVDNPEDNCTMYTFSVFASNSAGDGLAVNLTETLPLSPNIVPLENSLRVSSIIPQGIATEVKFSPATSCSVNFPLTYYLVTLTNENQSTTEMYSTSNSLISGQNPIILPVPKVDFERDQTYYVIVSACTSVTCRDSSPVLLKFLSFGIQLVNGSPRISGNSVFIDFTTNQQITFASCYLSGQSRQNCVDGYVRYDGVPVGSYIFRIVARSTSGERAVVRRLVHIGEIGDEDFCAVHLINEGVTMEGRTTSIFFQGTGTATSYLCQLSGPIGILGTRFQYCVSPLRYEELEAGNYRLQVRPVGCKNGKRLSVKFKVN